MKLLCAIFTLASVFVAGITRAEFPPLPSVSPSPTADDLEMGRRLQEELRSHGADVHGCYAIALDERAGLAGELLIRLHVAPGGGVERAEILQDQVGSGRLTQCLTDAMRHWRVPLLAGETTQQVVFPLAFKPDEVKPTPSAPIIKAKPPLKIKRKKKP